MWNIKSGKEVQSWGAPDLAAPDAARPLAVVSLGTDEKKNPKWGVAAAVDNKSVTVWDLTSRVECELVAKPKVVVRTLAVTPDGKTIAGATADEVVVWHVADKSISGRLPVKNAKRIGLTDHGKYAWAQADDVSIWNVPEQKATHRAADPAAVPLGWSSKPNAVRVLGFSSTFPSVYDLPGGRPDDPPTTAVPHWFDAFGGFGSTLYAVTDPRARRPASGCGAWRRGRNRPTPA